MPEKDEFHCLGKVTRTTVATFIPLVPRPVLESTSRPAGTAKAQVQAIWFDGSVKECGRAKKGTRLKDGLVDVLSATDNYKRGSTGGQTYLWPWRCAFLDILWCNSNVEQAYFCFSQWSPDQAG